MGAMSMAYYAEKPIGHKINILLLTCGGSPLNSAAYGMHYFNLVVFLDLGRGIFGPGNDLLVQGHGEIRRLNVQFLNQILKVLAFQDFPVFAINGQFQENLSKKGARFGPQ